VRTHPPSTWRTQPGHTPAISAAGLPVGTPSGGEEHGGRVPANKKKEERLRPHNLQEDGSASGPNARIIECATCTTCFREMAQRVTVNAGARRQ